MSRVKRGIIHTKKRKRVLRLAKGYRGGRGNLYVLAKEAVKRALAYSYVGRKQKKRDFRRLWITRISAATRREGLSYSRFMYGLRQANVDLNRKVLAEMAANGPDEFSKLVEVAKSHTKE